MVVDIKCDERYWQKPKKQLENACDRVNVTALVSKRLRPIAVCQHLSQDQGEDCQKRLEMPPWG